MQYKLCIVILIDSFLTTCENYHLGYLIKKSIFKISFCYQISVLSGPNGCESFPVKPAKRKPVDATDDKRTPGTSTELTHTTTAFLALHLWPSPCLPGYF